MNDSDDITVVHLDDDADLLELTSEFVERQDDRLRVESFEDSAAALSRIGEGSVDCVVTDYKMSDRDGLSFLRDVRAEDEELPVVFFTGKGSEEIASEAISLGVTDYLQKGSGTEQFQLLGNRVVSLVTRRRAQARALAADRTVRETYERITVAFLGLDSEFRVTYMNPHAEQLFGGAQSEFEGRVLWEAIPSLSGTALEQDLAGAMREQVDAHFEGEAAVGDDRKHLRMHAYPSDDGVSVFVEDVTAAVQQEAELEGLRSDLEISEQQFRTLRQKLSRPTSPFR